MEFVDTILASTRDLVSVVVDHPIYSAVGCVSLGVCLVRFYFKYTTGMCDSTQDMSGKTVLITGGSAGIGKLTAEDLARRNARVILACRNVDKARRVADEIIASTGNNNVVIKQLDLASFDSVRKCAEDVLRTEEKLDVLINNAGIFADKRRITEDGCEIVLQSNHLGHFLLTTLLLDLLKKSSPSRIINVSSGAYTYYKNFDVNDMAGKSCKGPMELYARSKLANVLFTTELATRLENTGVTVNVLHPGLVKTDIIQGSEGTARIFRIFMFFFGKTAEEGAQTTIYLAVHPEVEKTTGKYFTDCKEDKLVGAALNKSLAKQFFEASEKIVGCTYKWT